MNPSLMLLMGGSALLLFSMEALSKSAEYLAASRMRSLINAVARSRLGGLILGIILSTALSSSSAVTVMLVGLANSRLLSLEQIFSVTLGASIGSTFIVQLIAFRFSEYGLLLITLGVAIEAVARTEKYAHIANAILFLGLMFFSMNLIAEGGKNLEENELFTYTIRYFQDRPIVSLFIAAGLTALFHSSAATIAFVMSLMAAKSGSVYEALPWVLGANLGTTATAFLASFRGSLLGKQVALGHLVCKVTGIILCYPLMEQLGYLTTQLTPDLIRQIAHSHTLFNVAVAILFFPFISWGVRLVRSLLPESDPQGPFSFHYIDNTAFSTPEFALAQAHREILRLSDTVEQMVERSILLFASGSYREIEALKEKDQVVDFLNKGIKIYLTKLSQKEMTPEQVQKEFELLLRTNDLENIGDIVDKDILSLVRKTLKKGYTFSKEGWAELTAFHSKAMQCLKLSTAFFSSGDPALAAKLRVLSQEIDDMLIDLSELHVHRLHQGIKETLDTTSIHLDLLGHLQRISSLSVNFTKVRN